MSLPANRRPSRKATAPVVPLPMKGAAPDQNCVTWIEAALRALQDEELVEEFDVDEFMAYALRFADRRMAEGGRPEYVNYTSRRM